MYLFNDVLMKMYKHTTKGFFFNKFWAENSNLISWILTYIFLCFLSYNKCDFKFTITPQYQIESSVMSRTSCPNLCYV